MFRKILVFFAVAAVGLSLYAAFQPSQMFVQREVVISATPEAIFPYLNNSRMVNEWMPWREMDPKVEMTYSGPEEGVGARSSWTSSGQMGVGEALVTESVANQHVSTQLTYTEPFKMSQTAMMSLTPVDGGTKVSWSVSGQKNFFFRLLGVFFDCDQMIGGAFEKGLATLKLRVEKP